ncbi:unnamed protein product [Arctogadus glacialis]
MVSVAEKGERTQSLNGKPKPRASRLVWAVVLRPGGGERLRAPPGSSLPRLELMGPARRNSGAKVEWCRRSEGGNLLSLRRPPQSGSPQTARTSSPIQTTMEQTPWPPQTQGQPPLVHPPPLGPTLRVSPPPHRGSHGIIRRSLRNIEIPTPKPGASYSE